MKQKSRRQSLFSLLVLFLGGLLLSMTIVYGLSWKMNIDEKTTSTVRIVQSMNQIAALKMSTYISDLERLSTLPFTAVTAYRELNQPTSSENQQVIDSEFIPLAYNIMSLKKTISSVFLFNKVGFAQYKIRGASMYDSGYNPVNESWFSDVIALNGRSLIVDAFKIPNIVEDYQGDKYVFSVARKVFYYARPDEYGVLLINADSSLLNEMLEDIRVVPNQHLFVVNELGKVLSAREESLISQPFSEAVPLTGVSAQGRVKYRDKDYFMFEKAVAGTTWKIVNLLPYSYITDSIEQVNWVNSLFIGIMVLAWLIAFLFIVKYILTPIRKLTNVIILRNSGDRKISMKYKRRDEIGILIEKFNDYLIRIDDFVQKENKNKQREQQLELQILQEQINPHFLYNTIESIRMLAVSHEDTQVADIAYQLGRITRYSTSLSNQLVTVGDDLSIVQDYIRILRVCYPDRFTAELACPSAIKDLHILKFLIQPLIENCILHGFSQMSSGGSIKLQAYIEEDCLYITVVDNGGGIDPETMDTIVKNLQDKNTVGRHIGLYNVQRRIKLYYGNDYGLEIRSDLDKGTCMVLRLPVL